MWKHLGYQGGGNVEPLLRPSGAGVAVICGGARSVFDDLNHALELEPKAVIFATNDIGMYLANVHHWASLHYEKLQAWRAVRALDSSLGQDFKTHSNKSWDGVDFSWEGLEPVFAVSGYFAMQIAFLMGFHRIILCGCPGDTSLRFFDAKPRMDFGYGQGVTNSDHSVKEQLINEMKRLPEFKKRVQSLSGWTKNFFNGGV